MEVSLKDVGLLAPPHVSERVARESVIFAKPFFVEGLGRTQPAGTYDVEIVEELIEGLSFLAYRVVSTSIVLPLPGGGDQFLSARPHQLGARPRGPAQGRRRRAAAAYT